MKLNQKLLALMNGMAVTYPSAIDAAKSVHEAGKGGARTQDSTRNYISRIARKEGGGEYCGVLWQYLPEGLNSEEQAKWIRQRAAQHKIEFYTAKMTVSILEDQYVDFLESTAASLETAALALPQYSSPTEE